MKGVGVRVQVRVVVVAAVVIAAMAGSGRWAAASTSTATGAAMPHPTYQVFRLGAPAGGVSRAAGINELGQVSGTDEPLNGNFHAWVWSPSAPVRSPIGLYTVAGGVNESGDVAISRPVAQTAAVWRAATKQLVGLSVTSGNAGATDVNDDGLVVGWREGSPPGGGQGTTRAAQWEGGVYQDLGALGCCTKSVAYAVNASGQSVGESVDHAFRHDARAEALTDLGAGYPSWALDISDDGRVVGVGSAGTFVTAPNGTELTAIGGGGGPGVTWPAGINNHGVVVGTGNVTASLYDSAAIVRYPDGSLQELPGADKDPESSATAINDRGWIVGNIGDEAVLWVPTFADVPLDHPFFDAISWMAETGISTGDADGAFHGDRPVTRQGVAAFLYRLSGSPAGADPSCDAAPFADVPPDHPFCGEIAWLVQRGIATGYAGDVFRPVDPVSRQALAAFLYRLAGNPNGASPTCDEEPFDDVPTSSPFCGHIAWLAGEDIVAGYPDGGFHPAAAITRQAVASFLYEFDQR